MRPFDKNNTRAPNGFVTVVVLNDGETFSDIHGCTICVVPFDQYMDVVESGCDASDFRPVAEFSLSNVSIPLEDQ